MLSTTLLSSTYRIQEVRFSPESINVYDNPAMYNHIRDELHNKNYYRIKRQERDTIRQNFLKIFPIVRDISLEQSVPQRVYITLDFYEPTLVFRSPAGNTAAFDNSLFPLTSGNTLGNTTLTIDIPRYTS